jgi:hypothetical protein
VRGHQRLERVAGGDGDELAGLGREKLSDPAGILTPDGNAGENQRAGVDVAGYQPGGGIFLGNEPAERDGVDVLALELGRQPDAGLMNDAALDHQITRVETFEHDLGEQEMHRRRANVDADAGQFDLVLLNQASARVREEEPAAGHVLYRLADGLVRSHLSSGFS